MDNNDNSISSRMSNPDTPPTPTTDSLPSLSSVFKPEEFFDMDPIEETALSRLCCFSE
jgi:hypothetical protein